MEALDNRGTGPANQEATGRVTDGASLPGTVLVLSLNLLHTGNSLGPGHTGTTGHPGTSDAP